MKDFFALLGLPRRPWLDEETVKQRFLSLSGECHPDRLHHASEAEKRAAHEHFTALNEAHRSLLDPRERLLHLAELELRSNPAGVQNLPSDLMNLFFEVGTICRNADAVIAQRAAEISPLLKVQIFARAQERIEELQQLKRKVAASRETLLEEIRNLDTDWDLMAEPAGQSRWKRLLDIAGLLNYSKKWDAEIAERIVRLSF